MESTTPIWTADDQCRFDRYLASYPMLKTIADANDRKDPVWHTKLRDMDILKADGTPMSLREKSRALDQLETCAVILVEGTPCWIGCIEWAYAKVGRMWTSCATVTPDGRALIPILEMKK